MAYHLGQVESMEVNRVCSEGLESMIDRCLRDILSGQAALHDVVIQLADETQFLATVYRRRCDLLVQMLARWTDIAPQSQNVIARLTCSKNIVWLRTYKTDTFAIE